MSKLRVVSWAGSLNLFMWILITAPLIGVTAMTVSSTAAHAQGVIRNIQVEGNGRVEPETVRSYLQFSIGDNYDPGQVDKSVRALFATGLFSNVHIDKVGNTVIVTVVENPVINQVAFEGNYEIDDKALRSEVRLKPRAIYTRARVQADVQRIQDVYQRQGLFAASIEPQIIQLEHNRVNLVFEITEGTATKVKSINFVGNHAFSDSQLRDIISTTQTGWFDFLKGTAFYDPDRMNLDRALLRQYYLKNGYADARVTAANAELDRDGSGFFITFVIEEGQPYAFGEIVIESSLPELDTNALYAQMLTTTGAVYDGSRIDKTVEKLTLAVSQQGYAFARVRPRAIPDAYTQTIALKYVIDEGPRVYIDRINIIGNVRTKDYVIRREFRLAEGDAYNPLLVDRAKKRLRSLGFFEKVEVKRRAGSARDRVVLDVVVSEKSTGELSFGAGYSTAEGVIGDVSITERNLMGNGQFLRLKVGGSIQRFQVDLSFTEPRFLDRNLSAGFDIFHKELDQTSQSGFRSRKSGGALRLGFPLAENLWMQTRYTLSRDEVYDVEAGASLAIQEAAGEGEFAGQSDGIYWTSALGTTLTYDARNHPRNPTRGFFFQASSDFAGIGGNVQYVRVQSEGRAYYPVAENVTLVGRVVGGHIEGWGEDDVRLLDLFFRGGETIRGFDRAGFGPRDLTTGDALGGKTYWAATAELRFPIPLIPDELGISGAIFADAGSVFNATDSAVALGNAGRINLADDETIRSSVGASILWNSPVGPLRMDYAHVLSSENYDDEQAFRFGASSKF